MSLKTKTLLGALVLAVVAYGYYTYNYTDDAQDTQSNTGVVITIPAEETQPVNNESTTEEVETPTEVVTPTVNVEAAPEEQELEAAPEEQQPAQPTE